MRILRSQAQSASRAHDALLLQMYEPDHLDAGANPPKRSRTMTEAEAAEAMQAATQLAPDAAHCNHFDSKRS